MWEGAAEAALVQMSQILCLWRSKRSRKCQGGTPPGHAGAEPWAESLSSAWVNGLVCFVKKYKYDGSDGPAKRRNVYRTVSEDWKQ